MSITPSAKHRGWHYDQQNDRLSARFNGTEVFDFDADDLSFKTYVTMTAACGLAVQGACGLQVGVSTSAAGKLTLNSAGASGVGVAVKAADCTAFWTLTLPTNDGNCGQQLATNGSGVTSWAAACSSIDTKEILGQTCKFEAYDRVKNTTIYDYNYKPGFGLKSKVPYVGPVAEEAPFLMRGGDRPIFSDINGFGHLAAAFQVLAEKVERLENRETCNA